MRRSALRSGSTLAAALLLVLAPSGASGQVQLSNQPGLADVCGPMTCTVNGVTIVRVAPRQVDDACYVDGDTMDIFLRAVAQASGAGARYDVSLWIAEDDLDATTGNTTIVTFPQSSEVGATPSCSNFDPSCGSGPFLNLDDDNLDECADITLSLSTPDCGQEDDPFDPTDDACTVSDTNPDNQAVYDFPNSVTLPCEDLDGNGFADLAVCAPYHINAANSDCDPGSDLSTLCPDQPSDCTCSGLNGVGTDTTIPLPDMTSDCVIAPTTVRPGFPVQFRVSITNQKNCVDAFPALTCNQATDAPIEEARCGTASYWYYRVDDGAVGPLENGDFQVISEGARGAAQTVDDGTGDGDTQHNAVEWVPRSEACLRDGIIGPNGETDSLTVEYVVPPDAPTGPLTLSLIPLYTDVAPDTTTVPFTLSPTPVPHPAATTCVVEVDPSAPVPAMGGWFLGVALLGLLGSGLMLLRRRAPA